MRYLVEIDADTEKGAELSKHIISLNAPEEAIRLHRKSELTDEEMALPGKQPSQRQLEEWLSQPDYGYVEGNDALALLKEELATYRKAKK